MLLSCHLLMSTCSSSSLSSCKHNTCFLTLPNICVQLIPLAPLLWFCHCVFKVCTRSAIIKYPRLMHNCCLLSTFTFLFHVSTYHIVSCHHILYKSDCHISLDKGTQITAFFKCQILKHMAIMFQVCVSIKITAIF